MTPWLAFLAGWLGVVVMLHRLLARGPTEQSGVAEPRHAIAVITPARNESRTIAGSVVASLAAHATEVVVVDDDSDDDTAERARTAGLDRVRVIDAGSLPEGWRGKCHACDVGARATSSPVVAFVDADVRLQPASVAMLAAGLDDDTIASVQPWHDADHGFEQLSMIPNIVALVGSGAFGPRHRSVRVAFGPVLVMTRVGYERSGGFAAVRDETVEDVALARRFARRRVETGRRYATFRMHQTPREFVNGWTRVLRAGFANSSVLGMAIAIVWIAGLIAGFVSPLIYALNVVGVFVVGRIAGNFRWYTALLYPVALAAFVALCLRSLVARRVSWRGRSVAR